MVDAEIMKKDSSLDMNHQETRIAIEVSTQFIAKRNGRHLKLRRETQAMLTVVEELEMQRGAGLLNFIKTIKITNENGLSVLTRLSDQTFLGGISWGRITSLYLFSALLADHLRENGKESEAENIGLWLGCCIARRADWIRKEGDGWAGFIQTVDGGKEMENNIFNGLFNITLGLGTFAAALFVTAQ